jgi:alkylated DNA repair dioxygenase AlkB
VQAGAAITRSNPSPSVSVTRSFIAAHYRARAICATIDEVDRALKLLRQIEGGGLLSYQPEWLPASEAEAHLLALIEETPWTSRTLRIAGREVREPRLTAWYGDPEARYSYSGVDLDPLPWTARLARLRELVQQEAGAQFNAVFINYYRNERDSMGMHADKERELGTNPLIASLSFGATRRFILKFRKPHVPKIEIMLESGSLLVMSGTTQHLWRHGVPKESRPIGPRINLTFRRIYPLG